MMRAYAWIVIALGAGLVGCPSRRPEIGPTSLETASVDAGADGHDARVVVDIGETIARRCAPLADGCRVGKARRPSRRLGDFLSSDGLVVHYYQQTTHFDAKTLEFAEVLDCPLHEDVYARDVADVYTLQPQSCGGENCGKDYTGYYWRGLGVVHPGSFRWWAGGYGADDLHVYNVWHPGPLAHATPARFQVLLCDGESGFVLGREGGHLYRDGWERDKTEAL